MLKRKGRSGVLTRPQTSIFSAAMVIMVMAALSRVLGLVRNRILASVFSAEQLAVYFAAFRLPEVVFEILVYGALSSAIIPVLAEYFSRRKSKAALEMLSVALSWSMAIFVFFGLVMYLGSGWLYKLLLPGFDILRLEETVRLARILIFTQVFFAISYLLTAFLEVKKRFLVPALAPLFYNVGIIFGAIFLTERWGLKGLAWGAVMGSLAHLFVQLPLCVRLGWRYRVIFRSRGNGFRKVRRLAWPRMVELGVLQVAKSVELFLSSLISGGAYTY
ncbi:MATE family efflux transporter, partial [Patescibacteria group bacterium]|nr:MATE family efflux transporter [Patescibacteria group bacterium]